MLDLLRMEIKKVVTSIPFLFSILIFIVFMWSQCLGHITPITSPQPGLKDYGESQITDPVSVMKHATSKLLQQTYDNRFPTYPYGFIKVVKLNDEKLDEMLNILSQLTIYSKAELKDGLTAEQQSSFMDQGIRSELTYESFLVLMEQVVSLIGDGSSFTKDNLESFGKIPKTYEEAKQEYDNMLQNHEMIDAHARLFCDYAGIILSVLPVFTAVALCSKDRHSHMEELIYAKAMPSWKLIVMRMLACLMLYSILLFMAGGYYFYQLSSLYPGESLSAFTLLMYEGIWLIPSILVSLAVGFFFTALTSSYLGIFIQGVWWFFDVFMHAQNMKQTALFQLVPRFNDLESNEVFFANSSAFLGNRAVYLIFALILLLLTIIADKQKRKGRQHADFKFKKLWKAHTA